MERCPNCRARTDGADTCRRCGMDLTLLQATERAAEALCRRACRALAEGDPAAAVANLTRARALVPDPFIARLLGFARRMMEAGQWPVASGQWPVAGGRRSVAGGQRSVTERLADWVGPYGREKPNSDPR